MCASWSLDALRGIEQQHRDVGVGDRLQRLDHRELLDRLEHAALAAQCPRYRSARRLARALERHVDRIARGAGLVEGDQPLFAEPGVDQRALADVGPSGHGQADRLVGLCASSSARLIERTARERRCRAGCARPVRASADTGCGSPRPSSWNSLSAGDSLMPLGLVATVSTARLPLVRRNRAISWSCADRPATHVDDEQHRIGLGHRLARLLGHLVHDAGVARRLEAAGVDDDELAALRRRASP